MKGKSSKKSRNSKNRPNNNDLNVKQTNIPEEPKSEIPNSKSDEYIFADQFSKTGLAKLTSKLMIENEKMGLGTALVESAKLKLKAKMGSFKKQIDPLNIVKKLTNSDLATTMLGRVTGRSNDDIKYFTNYPLGEKKPENGSDPSKPNATKEKYYNRISLKASAPGISAQDSDRDIMVKIYKVLHDIRSQFITQEKLNKEQGSRDIAQSKLEKENNNNISSDNNKTTEDDQKSNKFAWLFVGLISAFESIKTSLKVFFDNMFINLLGKFSLITTGIKTVFDVVYSKLHEAFEIIIKMLLAKKINDSLSDIDIPDFEKEKSKKQSTTEKPPTGSPWEKLDKRNKKSKKETATLLETPEISVEDDVPSYKEEKVSKSRVPARVQKKKDRAKDFATRSAARHIVASEVGAIGATAGGIGVIPTEILSNAAMLIPDAYDAYKTFIDDDEEEDKDTEDNKDKTVLDKISHPLMLLFDALRSLFSDIKDILKNISSQFSSFLRVNKNPIQQFSNPSKSTSSSDSIWTPASSSKDTIKSNQDDKAKLAMKILMNKGWSKEQSAGIVGNLAKESSFNPSISSPDGKFQGLAQWDASRRNKFKEISGKDLKDATFEEQISFVDWELKNTHKKAGEAIRQTKTAEEAAQITEGKYEVTSKSLRGEVDLDRVNNAKRYSQFEIPTKEQEFVDSEKGYKYKPFEDVRPVSQEPIKEETTTFIPNIASMFAQTLTTAIKENDLLGQKGKQSTVIIPPSSTPTQQPQKTSYQPNTGINISVRNDDAIFEKISMQNWRKAMV